MRIKQSNYRRSRHCWNRGNGLYKYSR